MACNRIITGASLNMAAADAFVEPIINGFWFYFLLVFFKQVFVRKIEQSKSAAIYVSQMGILLAFLYTIGHILIAMTCNRLLTGAPLNLAVIDAFVEPVINVNQIGILLAFLYTIGHILIAMTCNRLLTGAPLNLAVIDAFVEPVITVSYTHLTLPTKRIV